MTRDIEVLRAWLLVMVVIAAVGATAVPVLYSFLPWKKHQIGPPFMLQAVSFAGALNITVLFAFWRPKDILIIFWVQALLFTAIAVSTSTLVLVTIRMRYPKRKRPLMLFNANVYAFLKRFVQVTLPATGLLYFTLAQFWNLPSVEAVMGTLTAVATFLGVCLGISTKEYGRTELKYDGDVVIESNDEGSTLRLNNVSQKALETKDEILLRINRTG